MNDNRMKGTEKEKPVSRRFGLGGLAVVLPLLAMFAGAVGVAFYVWNQISDVEITTNGWVAMGLGLFFTFVIGVGLMVLVFYSSRRNYDR